MVLEVLREILFLELPRLVVFQPLVMVAVAVEALKIRAMLHKYLVKMVALVARLEQIPAALLALVALLQQREVTQLLELVPVVAVVADRLLPV